MNFRPPRPPSRPPRPPGQPLPAHILDARHRAEEIRNRRRVVDRVLELIPPSIRLGKVTLIRGSGDTWHLRADDSQNLGQLRDRRLAQFLLDAPDHLRAFSEHIERLEQAAFDAREDRRRDEDWNRSRDRLLQQITDELLAADSLGPATKDGQRRVRSAIAAARRDDEH